MGIEFTNRELELLARARSLETAVWVLATVIVVLLSVIGFLAKNHVLLKRRYDLLRGQSDERFKIRWR